MDAIKARIDKAIDAHQAGGPQPKALVIGAGYIGLEMAENFHHRGVDVSVVELADQILPPLDKEMSVPVERYLRG
ncbi:MAG: FAD-dependent oxidoreductase, partial [Synechococcus sp.]